MLHVYCQARLSISLLSMADEERKQTPMMKHDPSKLELRSVTLPTLWILNGTVTVESGRVETFGTLLGTSVVGCRGRRGPHEVHDDIRGFAKNLKERSHVITCRNST